MIGKKGAKDRAARRIYLLRHAEAGSGGEDRARPLTSKGKSQAQFLGQRMKAQNMIPEYVICSPARRTRQTYDAMSEYLREVACIYPEYLYNAETEDVLSAIKNFTPSYNSVLLIGHNPSIHMVAKLLTGKGEPDAMNELAFGFKPATMAIIDCKCETWAEVEQGKNQLVQVIKP